MNNNKLEEMTQKVSIKGTPLDRADSIKTIIGNIAEDSNLFNTPEDKTRIDESRANHAVRCVLGELLGVDITDLEVAMSVDNGFVTKHTYDTLTSCGLNKVGVKEYLNSLDKDTLKMYKQWAKSEFNRLGYTEYETRNTDRDYNVEVKYTVFKEPALLNTCLDTLAQVCNIENSHLGDSSVDIDFYAHAQKQTDINVKDLFTKLLNKQGEINLDEQRFLIFLKEKRNNLLRVSDYCPIKLVDFKNYGLMGETEIKKYRSYTEILPKSELNIITKELVEAINKIPGINKKMNYLEDSLAEIFNNVVKSLGDACPSSIDIPRIGDDDQSSSDGWL